MSTNAREEALEWGPNLGEITRENVEQKILEYNKDIKSGEKLWRLPTVGELRQAFNDALEGFHVGDGKFTDNKGHYWIGPSLNVAGLFAGPNSTFGSGSDVREDACHQIRLVR